MALLSFRQDVFLKEENGIIGASYFRMDNFNASGTNEAHQGPSLRAISAALKKEAKRQATKAVKRRTTLVANVDNFYHDCGYEAFLLLKKGYRSYVYTSVDTASLPSILTDLVSHLSHQPAGG